MCLYHFTLQCLLSRSSSQYDLFLVMTLDVAGKVASLAECFIAMLTLVRSQSQVDGLDMSVEVALMTKCLGTILAPKRLLSQVDCLDMNLQLGIA